MIICPGWHEARAMHPSSAITPAMIRFFFGMNRYRGLSRPLFFLVDGFGFDLFDFFQDLRLLDKAFFVQQVHQGLRKNDLVDHHLFYVFELFRVELLGHGNLLQTLLMGLFRLVACGGGNWELGIGTF
jgi:hypothetical protein